MLILILFVVIELRSKAPMVQLSLFRIQAFTFGNIAGFCGAIARGGLQFMIVIWLQGIWLPLHGYSFSQTPLWAGIYMLPLTCGFLVAGPISGTLSDRLGSRGLATSGMLITAAAFGGMMLLPVDFSYPVFAVLLFVLGSATGMFASPTPPRSWAACRPRSAASPRGCARPSEQRHRDLDRRVFSLMIAGLAGDLHTTLTNGLAAQGLPSPLAHQIGNLPPVSSLFAAVLGINPIQHLLAGAHALHLLSPHARAVITGREFFSNLLSGPFHDGLLIVFGMSVVLSLIAAGASMLRGPRVTPEQTGRPGRAGSCHRVGLSYPLFPQPTTPRESMSTDSLPKLDPAHTALLVMDYQNGIVGTIENRDELLAVARNLIDAFRAHGASNGYVRVGFADGDLDDVRPTSGMAANVSERREILHADHPGTQIHDAVTPEPGDIVVRKQRHRRRSAPPTSTSSCMRAASTRWCWPASAPAASCSRPCWTRSTATTA